MMRSLIRKWLVIKAIALSCAGLSFAAPAFAAVEMQLTPVLAQPLARGEIIREDSITDREMRRSPAGIDYITDREALIGMAAKRPLRAGVPLRLVDIAQPHIIKKGEQVTVAFEAPGLSLSVRGKALEDGVYGQSIRVMNTQTNRTFEGVASASGYVLVSPPASRPSLLPGNAAQSQAQSE